jgi:hypothetical protein
VRRKKTLRELRRVILRQGRGGVIGIYTERGGGDTLESWECRDTKRGEGRHT